ncbi:hypothetical protein [Wolbachia endosymbiont of Drosophila simulans]|uniref:hypothetical protein n=1 Tax=Wolbachia endosymbiont of Drosophila simulans TaxID=77038 RepID=UPI0003A0DBF6|nr:hypothetical protein [Wolbachia endosymbiont of Drosophila simulans]
MLKVNRLLVQAITHRYNKKLSKTSPLLHDLIDNVYVSHTIIVLMLIKAAKLCIDNFD